MKWVVATFAALLLAGLLAWVWRRRRAALEARRLDERRLAQAQKMEAVGRLAGGLAHDVNNYLATIRAHAELLRQGEPSREQVVETMWTIERTVVKASSLLERLLTFARRQPVRPERLDLNDVIIDFEALVAGSLPAAVELVLDLAPELPAVVIDLAEIDQVLANLFVNAKDALDGAGRITLSTRVVTDAAGRQAVELVVADTGRGIPEEVQAQIFEPFFTTKSGQGSSGLGLATVEAIVRSAGGTVSVESRPARGSTFRLLLPAAPLLPVPLAAPASTSGAAQGTSILLVDDNQDFAAAIAAQLTSRGWEVTQVASAEAALARAESGERWNLVITDVQLPRQLGTELVAALRRLQPIRALYMSGYTDRINLRRGGNVEAYFLKKPFSAQGLLRMVEELLSRPVDTMAT